MHIFGQQTDCLVNPRITARPFTNFLSVAADISLRSDCPSSCTVCLFEDSSSGVSAACHSFITELVIALFVLYHGSSFYFISNMSEHRGPHQFTHPRADRQTGRWVSERAKMGWRFDAFHIPFASSASPNVHLDQHSSLTTSSCTSTFHNHYQRLVSAITATMWI